MIYCRYLEHVVSPLLLKRKEQFKRGDLRIYLQSPSGTRSTLLENRPKDSSTSGFTNWPFMTTHSWGERPTGKWILEIFNDGNSVLIDEAKFIVHWSLKLYGVNSDPNFNRQEEETYNRNIRVGGTIQKYLISKILKG